MSDCNVWGIDNYGHNGDCLKGQDEISTMMNVEQNDLRTALTVLPHLFNSAIFPNGLIFAPIWKVQHALAMKHPIFGLSHVPGLRRKGVLPVSVHPEEEGRWSRRFRCGCDEQHRQFILPVGIYLPATFCVSFVTASCELH